MQAVPQVESGQELRRPPLRLSPGEPVDLQCDHDVFHSGEEGDQVVGLEDEPELFAAQPLQVDTGDPPPIGHRDPVDDDPAEAGLVDKADGGQEGGLPGTGRSEDRHQLPGLHLQRRLCDGGDGGFPAAVDLGQVFDFHCVHQVIPPGPLPVPP